MAVESIAKTLGAGSGIDLKGLVDSLVDAQFAPKKEALKKREEALTAQISKAAELRQVVTQFDQALKTLVRGGELTSKLVSSDGAVRASFQPGASPRDLSASVGVKQIASAQVST
ncbi:MAG TPA: flagellar cap protein FliD N-terminal domain-containing protein, partial [Sphingomonas sp.]